MSVLKTRNLTKRFGKLTALAGVDLEVNQGEIYGFIGPNGAGKTTAIRILLGILKATRGQATIFDKDAWKDAVKIHKNYFQQNFQNLSLKIFTGRHELLHEKKKDKVYDYLLEWLNQSLTIK